MFLQLILIFLYYCSVSHCNDKLKGLYETSGFHCYSRDSMKLPRHLHGPPQTTDPPFDISVYDHTGRKVSTYVVGNVYTVKLEAYVHFRGLMLQPRLCTPSGRIIGSLRGGRFIEDEQFETHGIGFHDCGRLHTNDSITHVNDDKKFLAEVKWTTSADIGNVQFVATIATENVMYWEKWRPANAFLRGPYQQFSRQDPNIFVYNIDKKYTEKIVTMEVVHPSQHPLFEEQKKMLKSSAQEASENTEDVFDVKTEVFEAAPPRVESSKFVENEHSFMASRMYKKFAPLNDTGLGDDDLKFLNAHAQLQHDFVDNNDIEMEDKCQGPNPCENGGKCMIDKGKVKCQCGVEYSGEKCEDINKCLDHNCSNNSTCINDKSSKLGYTCQCNTGNVGNFCELVCEPDRCINGGKCVMNSFGKVACKCVPGTIGRRCEREINECSWNKCQNGAKCVDLLNDYRCECADGWMGRNCDRPCRDVYGSCRVWKRDGQCEQTREATDFFDLNCASSCGICKQLTVPDDSYLPIQPILMPFAWLLGEWKSYIKGWNNHTTDYPTDIDGMAYNETIVFSVIESLSFGTPYINYTATMTSEADPTNIHVYNGFITIQQYKNDNQTSDKGALTTVSNTGLIMIEEGDISEQSGSDNAPLFMLTPTYIQYKDGVKPGKTPEKMKRWFTMKNGRLMQYMVREFKGRTHKFTKIYKRSKVFKYL